MKTDDFYRRVYDVVEQIPMGQVTTYGAIARYLGVASAARTVGYALNNLIYSEKVMQIPAHRVVNRLGELTGRGHFPGNSMKERLMQENIEFTGEYTVNIEKHLWDPQEMNN